MACFVVVCGVSLGGCPSLESGVHWGAWCQASQLTPFSVHDLFRHWTGKWLCVCPALISSDKVFWLPGIPAFPQSDFKIIPGPVSKFGKFERGGYWNWICGEVSMSVGVSGAMHMPPLTRVAEWGVVWFPPPIVPLLGFGICSSPNYPDIMLNDCFWETSYFRCYILRCIISLPREMCALKYFSGHLHSIFSSALHKYTEL